MSPADIREILERKFTVRKRSNHFKSEPVKKHVTMDYFEPHRKMIKAMMKAETEHQYLTDKHHKRIADGLIKGLPRVRLSRLQKKWESIARKLNRLLGKS
jgi:outer membrane lipopolysaccharide assembly protein LptE/RlpB